METNLVDLDTFVSLPAPVLRYLRRVFSPGQRRIAATRLIQSGRLRADVNKDRWFRFSAVHHVRPLLTEFQWTARVSVLPFVHLLVTDSYRGGIGSGNVKLLSAIPLTRRADGEAMNAGSLHRYLAEAVWYPTALLPQPGLSWSAIDACRALATLTHAGTTVALEFRFGPEGDVSGIYTPGRWGSFADGFKQVPWEGHFADYTVMSGLRVPSRGEVGWHIDGHWHCVWKGQVRDAQYEFLTERS